MSFKKNTKIMLGIKTALLALLMIFGAVAMYIIIDGGNLQDIIKNVQFYGTVSLIAGYMGLSSILTSMSAFKQAVFDVEDKEEKVLVVSENGEVQKDEQNRPLYKVVANKIQVLKNTNAELNNKLTIEQGNEFAKEYNKKKRAEKQADANETLIRKLTAKMYKKDNSVKAEELKLKLKATKSKFVKQILKYRIKRCLKYLIIEKKINKIKNGKLNAKLKDYKPIKRKDFMSVEIEPTKDRQDIKLRSTLKRKTFLSSLGKAMFINFIYSFGFTALLQSLFDYDFANKWVGLAIFIGFYICSLLLQYIIYYVGTLKSYAIECEEILRNRHQMLKGCENVNVV